MSSRSLSIKKATKAQEKFNELLVYIVANCAENEPIEEIKLWKFLYFCDADFYFKSKNNTITGVTYIKNKYGPTPDKRVVDRAIKHLKGIIRVGHIKMVNGKTRRNYSIKLPDDFTYKAISADEIEMARKTCDKYKKLSIQDLLFLAHQDPPYAGSDVRIAFDLVKYRLDGDEAEELIEEANESYSGKISLEAARGFLEYARATS